MQIRLVLGLVLIVVGVRILGAAQTTVTLSGTPNTATFGSPVTFIATVTPTAATGKITFYDGVFVLGTSAVTNGKATLTTSLMASGSHSIRAYYLSDSTYGSSSSSLMVETVTAVPAMGFSQEQDTLLSGEVLLVADFNGDGKPDVVATQVGSSKQGPYGRAFVALGEGNGTFQPAQAFYQSASANQGDLNIATGDFDGDGKTDVVLTDLEMQTVNVLMGKGDGTFQPAISSPTIGSPVAVTVGDLNGDGNLDIVITSQNPGTLSVLLGNGDGTFQAAINYAGISSISLAVGDFNGDGFVDLALSNAILLGNGDGSFRAPINYPSLPGQIAAADLNGDGKLDLAIAGQNGGLFVLLGNGDGSFQKPASYPYGGPLAIGDVNGDGKADIAIAGASPGLLLGNGDGTFQHAASLGLEYAFAIAMGDFIGDGRNDIAVLGSELAVLPGTGPLQLAFMTEPANTPVGMVLPSIAVSELDASGKRAVGYGSVPVTLTSNPAGVNKTAMITAVSSATFSNILFSATGTYTLVANSPGVSPATSDLFQITGPPNVTVSGQVTVAGVGLGGVTITAAGYTTSSTTTDALRDYGIVVSGGTRYTITASFPGYSFSAPVTFTNLSANQTASFVGARLPVITAVANGASFLAAPQFSAGSWVTIFGSDLAPAGDSRSWNPATEIVNGQLPTSLDGTSVTVNSKLAAVAFISPSQVNIQVPDSNFLVGAAIIVTTVAGGSASTGSDNGYSTVSPGLFSATSPYLVAQHADGSYVTTVAPARPGEVITLWGTGFGPANPAVPAGHVFSGANPLVNTVTATIGGQLAAVDFAGVVGAGLVQVNVHVPSNISNGDAPVVATVVGVQTQATANMISIHN